MQYMMMFYETPDDVARRSGADGEAHMGGWMAYIGALYQAGIAQSGEGLLPPSTGTTLRVARRQAPGAGRPLRGHQGATRRLHDHRRAAPGQRARMGRARALRRHRRCRSAARDAAHGLVAPKGVSPDAARAPAAGARGARILRPAAVDPVGTHARHRAGRGCPGRRLRERARPLAARRRAGQPGRLAAHRGAPQDARRVAARRGARKRGADAAADHR